MSADEWRTKVERVRELMLGAVHAHTIEEIRRRLEKIHGVRWTKSDVRSALAQLGKSYELIRNERGFPSDAQFRLGAHTKQTSLFEASNGDTTTS